MKNVCLVLALIMSYLIPLSAGQQGPMVANAATGNPSVGSMVWSNPSNVTGDTTSSSYASVTLAPNIISYYLKTTYFYFTIPDTATITGVSVRFSRKCGLDFVYDYSIKLVKGGTIQGNNYAGSSAWTTTDETGCYGGASDLWGLSLSPSDINSNSNFGCVISVKNMVDDNDTAMINWVTMTVYYTVSSSKKKIRLFSQTSEGVIEERYPVVGD